MYEQRRANQPRATTPEQIDPHAVVRITFELNQLRQEARHGWLRIGEHPESVAEHSQRAAAFGYLLAEMESFSDPNLVCTMIVFHDMPEARTGDGDLVQKQYCTPDEEKALDDQIFGLGRSGEKIKAMWLEVDQRSSEAGSIAKDAEILEMAFTARSLVVAGNDAAQVWIDSLADRLVTDSAKSLLKIINSADPNEWWRTLCKL